MGHPDSLLFCAFFVEKGGMLEQLMAWVSEASPCAVHFATNVATNTAIASFFPVRLVTACTEVVDKV